MVNSFEIIPEPKPQPRLNVDKSQENIKKLNDLEHKEKIELENQSKINEAIRLHKIHQ